MSAALPDLQSSFGIATVNAEITRQATMVAYVDDFRLMAVIAVLSFALILLLRQPRKMPGAQAAAFVDVGHA